LFLSAGLASFPLPGQRRRPVQVCLEAAAPAKRVGLSGQLHTRPLSGGIWITETITGAYQTTS
jgi:hypothetical protein